MVLARLEAAKPGAPTQAHVKASQVHQWLNRQNEALAVLEANGATPTLMYGYGGFQISRTPAYSATVGHGWLARGGAYVVANIRGGGEYGPAWHQAAQKENKQRSYDDFIAIGEDLVRRDITSPSHLGIRGGSNGGLLTGVVGDGVRWWVDLRAPGIRQGLAVGRQAGCVGPLGLGRKPVAVGVRVP